ncbi:ATP-binding cassette domain-containing protein [Microbacterium elymi]|uniref:Dipeptide/oligopeptide/nickel ABC transporter ATP-binding protein n=1 Tax=Microbacterium elymi TaxID=2909587 RepID=A0ABY5NHT6_9MICO|nr:dipeptide/oligopeptide/nickel ABC transporter ATP-binding protein [Microbacterium elymi]UUT34696.1 dipeptide/oligopeptide/nickel ABC transporter ATP-binding protein [Microbacterium elymi]
MPGGIVHAVDDVSFTVGRGESLALVGESGCGKSTLARTIMRLPKPTSGSVRFRGEDLAKAGPHALRRTLRHMQMIFQDPISSLNPRRRVRDIIAEGLRIHRTPRERVAPRVEQIMAEVGLDVTTMADRRPGDFSGGQCQRIAIARAMAMEPQAC